MTDNKLCILNFFNENTNYGAIFVSYAMFKVFERFGYKPYIVCENYKLSNFEKFKSEEFINFKKEYFKDRIVTPEKKNYKDLNNKFDIFVVGSDQVWNPQCAQERLWKFLLDFAYPEKFKIAYGASFGKTRFSHSKEEIDKAKKLIKRFDSISVRESNAVNLIKETFSNDINAELVLDPTLLITENDYAEIINADNRKEILPQDYIGYYILQSKYNDESNSESIQQIEKLAAVNNLDNKNCRYTIEKYRGKSVVKYKSFADWLNIIRNSKIFITNSFHGVCFAINFKKNFVYWDQNPTNNSRLISLFANLNLNMENRIITDLNNIDIKYLLANPINYEIVQQNVDNLREQSLNYIEKALNNTKDNSYLIAKLKKANDEKNIEIEQLKKWNIKVLFSKFICKIKEIERFLLIFLGRTCFKSIYRMFPEKLKDFIRKMYYQR